MSFLKDSAIFKSSGMLLLSSPTSHTLPARHENLLSNPNILTRPSSRGLFNSKQISQPNQFTQSQQYLQISKEKLPQLSGSSHAAQNLSTSSQQLQNSYLNASQNGSRKNSLISKNMNSDQLKDWLIGKKPSLPTLAAPDKNHSQNKQSASFTHINQSISTPQKVMEFLNVAKSYNTPNHENQAQPQENLQSEQTQQRRSIRRSERRTQSEIIYKADKEEIEPERRIIVIRQNPSDQKRKNEEEQNDNSEKTDNTQQRNQTGGVVRKRVRVPSFNPTTVGMFEMNVQQQKQQQQLQQQQSQYNSSQQLQQIQTPLQSNPSKIDAYTQQQPQITESHPNFRVSRTHLFSSPTKTIQIKNSSLDFPPMVPQSMTNLMETSQTGFHKSYYTPSMGSYNNLTIPSQSQKNLSQRQILLKDLQNITDSRKLLEISSNVTPLNTKLGSNAQQTNSHQDQLNQQLGRKLNIILHSPNSTASSSPLDEMLSTTATTTASTTTASCGSYSALPLIKNRQIKNISLTNIELPSKLSLHPTSTRSSVIQNVWGSSSTLESSSELHQAQPRGILKQKRDSSKTKKTVVFDKKLQIHELGTDQQQIQ